MADVFEESWFYAPIGKVGDGVPLSDDESNHLLKVLRIHPGRTVVVSNGEGKAFLCRTFMEKGRLLALAEEEIQPAQPRPQLSIILGLLKGRDIEEPVEGLCQLPLAAIHLVLTDHCQVHKAQEHERLMERLRAKSIAALKQSKKFWHTPIYPPCPLREWRRAHPGPLILVHPGPDRIPRPLDNHLYVLIGPEGGFSTRELNWVLGDENAGTLGLGFTRIRSAHAPLIACGKLMGLGLL